MELCGLFWAPVVACTASPSVALPLIRSKRAEEEGGSGCTENGREGDRLSSCGYYYHHFGPLALAIRELGPGQELCRHGDAGRVGTNFGLWNGRNPPAWPRKEPECVVCDGADTAFPHVEWPLSGHTTSLRHTGFLIWKWRQANDPCHVRSVCRLNEMMYVEF